MNQIDATSRKVIVAKTIHNWPAGYHTKSYWKYECDRRIKKGAKPSFVEIEDASDSCLPFLTDVRLEEKANRTARGSSTSSCVGSGSLAATIVISSATTAPAPLTITPSTREATTCLGSTEALMVQHLRGESVYGLFAQESFPRRPARAYWVAADLDLHLATGGNLDIFREQVTSDPAASLGPLRQPSRHLRDHSQRAAHLPCLQTPPRSRSGTECSA